MTTTRTTAARLRRYHPNAYQFLFQSLQFTQQRLGRSSANARSEEDAHISGQELSEGIGELARRQFGLMARAVFRNWGITETADFGRMVFEMIERGEMKKTERDRLTDFYDVYDFADAFERDYTIDTAQAFRRHS
ncbi:MAG: hypothetical protein KDA79_20220 [Planctomycetaceae bacterium]|nr:hypothetical protein [Planctomycetaceae bacterium]